MAVLNSLYLVNGNRWLLEYGKEGDTLGRVADLLCLKPYPERMENILFPFFPYSHTEAYTFFEFTRDYIGYYHWFETIGQNTPIKLLQQHPIDPRGYLANINLAYQAIVLRNEIDKGFLVHGVMLKYKDEAIVLAGASGAGKTTAARRMPEESWEKCSDDLTLVVKSREGKYFAYPWPGSKAYLQYSIRYDLMKVAPLKALFFLVQDSEVSIERVDSLKAIAMLQRVVDQAMSLPDPSVDPGSVGKMRKNRLKNLTGFIQSVPTYELFLNKKTPFWEEIESLLDDEKHD